MHPTAGQQQALDQLAAELAAAAGPALPGTLVVRAYECGKPRCRCHNSPAARHGPYAEWTRKIGGKTVTRRLTPEQLTDWQPEASPVGPRVVNRCGHVVRTAEGAFTDLCGRAPTLPDWQNMSSGPARG